jgi:hypothetical protein
MAWSQESIRHTATERPYLSGTLSYATANVPQAKKGFLWALKSDNDGAVESALAHIAQMRIMLPREEMKDIETALSQLAGSGRTQVIRYKAFLATQVFASPGLFQEEAAARYESGDEFFTAIASRLQRTMLGLNVN